MESNPDKVRVLGMEKRLVDVELSLAQLNEKLKTIDTSGVSEIKQRLEDVEDLVLVDNAGVMELKKLLEGTQPSKVPDELGAKVDQLAGDVEKLKQAEPAIAAAPGEDLKKYIDDKLSELGKAQPAAVANDTKNELMIVKTRLSALEKSTTEPKNDLSKPVLDELQSIREELLTIKSKIASTEKFAQDINMRVDDIEPSLTKVETVSNIDTTLRQADAKLQAMAEMMSKMESMRSRIDVSSMYKLIQDSNRNVASLQNELQNLETDRGAAASTSQLKDAVTQINQQMDDMRKRLEGNRLFLMEMFKEDIAKAVSQLDQGKIYENINRLVDSKLMKFNAAYDEKIKETLKTMEEDMGPSIVNEQMIELVNRTLYLETRLSALEKSIKEFQQTTMPIIIE